MTFLNEHLTRQLDIIPMDTLEEEITIIGAGAIGGWTTLALAKMGFTKLTVYDFDVVDTANMSCQFFRFSDVGSKKVIALRSLVQDFTNVKISIQERYIGQPLSGIVVMAVDSMEVRKMIWDKIVENPYTIKLVVDPRMGAESALLYSIQPKLAKDRQDYASSLYSDSQATVERCTAKATIYTANLLSGMVVKAVKDHLLSNDPLRIVQWDIANNEQIVFSRSGKPVSI